MLNFVWQKNRDMTVASTSISVVSWGIILRFINISLCYHKLEFIFILAIRLNLVKLRYLADVLSTFWREKLFEWFTQCHSFSL